jgi:V8-like Glu-specific endopeptidase
MNVLSTGSRRALRALAIAGVVVPVLAAGTGAYAAARDVMASAPGAAAAGVAGFTPTVTADAARAAQTTSGLRASADAVVVAYWTPERMHAARPVEESGQFRRARTAPQVNLKSAPAPKDSGRELLVPPSHGTVSASTMATMATDPNLPTSHPTAFTNGKVFFTRDGGNWVCSGTIVNTPAGNEVWTAGHCIHGGRGGTLASNWAFVPAYNGDAANPRPLGTWTATSLWTMTAWINDSNFAEDMGVAVMGTQGGQHILRFGGQGLWVNVSTNQFMNAFGYPQEAPFTGTRLKQCAAWSVQEFPTVWTQTIKITPCNFTGGASGGPWLINYDGQWGLVNGINSRADRATWVASPYFDDTALTLYNFTKNF